MHALFCGPLSWGYGLATHHSLRGLLSWGLGLSIHALLWPDLEATLHPRFFLWPLELGLCTINPHFVVWPLELGFRTHNRRFVGRPLELGCKLCSKASLVGVRDSHSNLCCAAP